MRPTRIPAGLFVLEHTPDMEAWEELLRSACDTLVCVPQTMTKSISVTGNLQGVEGEALQVLTLSKQLAAEYGLEEVVKMQGHCFTARFWRRDSESHGNGDRAGMLMLYAIQRCCSPGNEGR